MVRYFNTEFASLNPDEKQRLKDEFHNVILEERSYKNITGFKAGKLAIANERQNAKRLLLPTGAGTYCLYFSFERPLESTYNAQLFQE